MRPSSFAYLLREGIKNIWLNRLMSLASIGVLTACLILVGVAVLFTMNMNSTVQYIESQNELVVFIDDQVDINEFENSLRTINNIAVFSFVSKQQGFDELKNSMGEESHLFDSLDPEDILPNSYKLSLTDLSLLNDTVDEINIIPGVISINAPQKVADVVTITKQTVETIGIIIVAVLATVSIVIIANTIKVTVHNRRKEINIMKFVGATDTFIRLPFLIEGVLLGIISATIAFASIYFGYNYLFDMVESSEFSALVGIKQSLIPFDTIFVPLAVSFATTGIVTGMFGSMLFVRKYLRV